MMEGVTILAQEEIMNVNAIGAVVGFIGFTILGLLVGAWIFYHSDLDCFLGIGIVVGFVVGLIFFIYTMENGEPTGAYEYRVTIDETVSFTDFFERYEIIDQDGLIYEIKEKQKS